MAQTIQVLQTLQIGFFMHNDMMIYSTPMTNPDHDICDGLLEIAGIRVIYLDMGLSFLGKDYRMVFYQKGDDENDDEHGTILRTTGTNG